MDFTQVPPATVLRAVGNDNRLRIINLLRGRELCVCELVDTLGRPHYAVSRDLAALQKAGFIQERRAGSWVYHSISPQAEADPFLGGLLHLLERRLATMAEAAADRLRLARRLALRIGDRCVVAVADVAPEPPEGQGPFLGGPDGDGRDL